MRLTDKFMLQVLVSKLLYILCYCKVTESRGF